MEFIYEYIDSIGNSVHSEKQVARTEGLQSMESEKWQSKKKKRKKKDVADLCS